MQAIKNQSDAARSQASSGAAGWLDKHQRHAHREASSHLLHEWVADMKAAGLKHISPSLTALVQVGCITAAMHTCEAPCTPRHSHAALKPPGSKTCSNLVGDFCQVGQPASVSRRAVSALLICSGTPSHLTSFIHASAIVFILFDASVCCLLKHMQHVSSELVVHTADGCECVQAYGHTMDFTRMVHLLRASWSAPSSAKPNLLTYNAAISVCSRVGQLGRAIRLLNEMVRLQCLSYTICASFLAPLALPVQGCWHLFVRPPPTQMRCRLAQQCMFASGRLIALASVRHAPACSRH